MFGEGRGWRLSSFCNKCTKGAVVCNQWDKPLTDISSWITFDYGLFILIFNKLCITISLLRPKWDDYRLLACMKHPGLPGYHCRWLPGQSALVCWAPGWLQWKACSPEGLQKSAFKFRRSEIMCFLVQCWVTFIHCFSLKVNPLPLLINLKS